MKSSDKTIIDNIITSNFIMTLGTIVDEKPHLCTVFYVTKDNRRLYFKSRTQSIHSQSFVQSPFAAASIYTPESNYVDKAGVQLQGAIKRVLNLKEMASAIALYGKAFKGAEKKFEALPKLISDFANSTMYSFDIETVKFVDSTKGIHTLEYENI